MLENSLLFFNPHLAAWFLISTGRAERQRQIRLGGDGFSEADPGRLHPPEQPTLTAGTEREKPRAGEGNCRGETRVDWQAAARVAGDRCSTITAINAGR